MSDKKTRKFKSDFGLGETSKSSKDRYDDDDSKYRSKKYDDDKKSRSKDESRSKKTDKKYDDDDYEKSKSRHRSKQDDDYKSESRHKSKNRDEDDKKSKNKSRDQDDTESRHRSSKYDDDRKSRRSERKKDDDETESRRERKSKKEEEVKKEDPIDEYNYDDDFDDDFENDSEVEPVKEEKKKYDSDDEYKNKSKSKYADSEEEDYKKKSSKSKSKYDDEDDYKKSSKSKVKYEDYDDYDDYNGPTRGRVVKANALVKIPTDSVEVFSSKIYFNHDSNDRQRRRAKDLFKNLIELDKKSFGLLDINPTEMRTVYSAHLRHEKIQTNDDNFEIDCQTDEIEYVTRWTQNPAEDSKGYGIENERFAQENSDDILQKFRININMEGLQKFLEKSSKVIESLLKTDSENNKLLIEETKTEFEMSQGFCRFEIPKLVSKQFKHFRVAQCSFSSDEPNNFVCSYNLPDENNQSTLFLVWNLLDPKKPYRVLTCETVSTCVNYTSFMVMSGNLDGSICLWDLRESHSIHSFNSKNKSIDESSLARSPTYTTAGVFLNENHMSEVRTIINLQAQSEKNVFMQIASLELEAKLIIWTVIEIKNSDLTVFETDLGLLPGGKLKLVKSSQILLNNVIWSPFGKTEYQTLNMTNSVNQPNHFFISTNIGQIIHINRKGGDFSTSVMKSNFSDSLLIVTDVSFHHEISDLLLACYGNGEIRLYHTNYVKPIKTWNLGCLGQRIKEIKWIESRSSCFSLIDEQDCFYVWDLLIDDTQPVIAKHVNGFGGISYSVYGKQTEETKSVPFASFKKNSKEVEVHLFNKDWVKKSEKESKKFSKLIKNYLISF